LKVDIVSKNWCAAWITASQPPGVPTPSWIGLKKVDRQAVACVLAHLDTKRWSVNPTAMGLIPPDFLFKAINRPPKKMEATSTGHHSASTILMKPVIAVKKAKRVISSAKEKKQKECANDLNDSECQNKIF